ncbi:hypothetical protein COCC4DRAFT_32394, partial [Bipolaris maydis ATCC 48331]
ETPPLFPFQPKRLQKRPRPNDDAYSPPSLDTHSAIAIITRQRLIIRNLKIHLFSPAGGIINSMIPHRMGQTSEFIRVQLHLFNNITMSIITNISRYQVLFFFGWRTQLQ